MSEISETEIKAMTKEQNYIRGYKDGYIHGYKNGKYDVLDKIRGEIEKLEYLNIDDGSDGYDKYIEQYEVLKIIDKYKGESEVQDANSN